MVPIDVIVFTLNSYLPDDRVDSLIEMFQMITSPRPSMILTAMRAVVPSLAAGGVSSVNTDVTKVPNHRNHFPPYFSAKKPPEVKNLETRV